MSDQYTVYPPSEPFKNLKGFGCWIKHSGKGIPRIAEHNQVAYRTKGGGYGQARGQDLGWFEKGRPDDILVWALKEGHRFYFDIAATKTKIIHPPRQLPAGTPTQVYSGMGHWIRYDDKGFPAHAGGYPMVVQYQSGSSARRDADHARGFPWRSAATSDPIAFYALPKLHPYYHQPIEQPIQSILAQAEDNPLYGQWS